MPSICRKTLFCSVCRLAGIRLQLLLVFVLHWIAFGLCFVSPTNQTIPTTTTEVEDSKPKPNPNDHHYLIIYFRWQTIEIIYTRWVCGIRDTARHCNRLWWRRRGGDKRRIKWRKLTKWKTKHMSYYYYYPASRRMKLNKTGKSV